MSCRSRFMLGRPLIVASTALSLLLPLAPSSAQTAIGVIPDRQSPDSAQIAAMMAMSMRMRSPASLALTMKQELGLSPEQAGAIEALARAEADSSRVRFGRASADARQRTQGSQDAMVAGMSWTGPIDEAAIRAAACEQSRAQADLIIGMMRDRHALGALLTADQQRRFEALQVEMMMRAFPSPHK